MLDLRPTPAHVTAVSAAKLPRLVLVALLVCFIFAGLYDRGIWSVREGAAIGEIVEMARGTMFRGFSRWLPGSSLPITGRSLCGWALF